MKPTQNRLIEQLMRDFNGFQEQHRKEIETLEILL